MSVTAYTNPQYAHYTPMHRYNLTDVERLAGAVHPGRVFGPLPQPAKRKQTRDEEWDKWVGARQAGQFTADPALLALLARATA